MIILYISISLPAIPADRVAPGEEGGASLAPGATGKLGQFVFGQQRASFRGFAQIVESDTRLLRKRSSEEQEIDHIVEIALLQTRADSFVFPFGSRRPGGQDRRFEIPRVNGCADCRGPVWRRPSA
jgi:hypothetical protein